MNSYQLPTKLTRAAFLVALGVASTVGCGSGDLSLGNTETPLKTIPTDAGGDADRGACAADEHSCGCATGSYCLKIGAACIAPTADCPSSSNSSSCAADEHSCGCATGSYCLKIGAACIAPTAACPSNACAADEHSCACATGSYCLKSGASCLAPTAECP